MERKLILFDVDMTLIDTGGVGKESFKRTWAEIYPETPFPVIDHAGKTDPLILRETIDACGFTLTKEEFEGFVSRFKDVYLGLLPLALKEKIEAGVCRPMPGVFPLLEELQARGAALALVTGNWIEGAELKLTPLGLWKYFKTGAFATDSAVRADLPPIAIKRAEKRFGREFAKKDVWIVGDARNDVDCGLANGIKVLAVATGSESEEALAAFGAAKTVPDLADLEAVLAILLAD